MIEVSFFVSSLLAGVLLVGPEIGGLRLTGSDDPVVGARGRVLPSSDSELWVSVQGARWKATRAGRGEALRAGTPVKVVALDGLRLVVEPIAETAGPDERSRIRRIAPVRLVGMGFWGIALVLSAVAYASILPALILVPAIAVIGLLPLVFLDL